MSAPQGIARATLDALPHNVTVVDDQRRLVYANPSFWRVAGIDPAACPIGSPIEDLIRILCYRGLYGPGDPEAQVQAVLRIDRRHPFRRRVRAADGRMVTEIMSYPLADGGYATCGVDVTASADAEAAIQARLSLIEGALGRAQGGLVIFDSALRLRYANPAYGALIGVPSDVTPGMTPCDILDLLQARGEFGTQGDTEGIAERIERLRDQRHVAERERPNGQVLRFLKQPTAEGGLVEEVTDITALRRAEDEARRRATVLDGALGTLPHGVCVFGPDRRVTMVNAAYARIMAGAPVTIGEHAQTILARRVATGEFSAEHARRTERALLDQAGDVPRELRRTRPNGAVITIRAARLPDGGHISVVTDITALASAEAEAEARLRLLDGVMATLPHGVLVYCPDGCVAMFNAAYARIMAGAPLALGEHMDTVNDRRVAAGEFSAEYLHAVLSKRFAPGASGQQEIVRTRPNGTVIAIRTAELPDGGHISVVTDITALHHAEERARERTAQLESSLGAMRHGTALFGPDQRLIATNPPMAVLTGVPHASRRLGLTLRELLQAQVAHGGITTAQVAASLALDRSKPQSYMRRDSGGSVAELTSDPTPDGGFVITLTDVTALHHAQAQARDRAALLERTLGAMRHGIAMFGPDHRLILSNAQATALADLPAALMSPGATHRELLEAQAERRVLPAARVAAALALDRSKPHRVVHTRSSGQVVESVSDPMPDGGFVVSFSDITALHQAEAQARDRAAMLDAMIAHMPHGVCVYDPDRRVRLTNAAYHAILGDAAGQIGEALDDLVARRVRMGEITPERGQMVRDTIGKGEHDPLLWRIRPNGTAITTQVGQLPDGGMLSVITDVTALHRAEEAARQRAAMLDAVLEALPVGVTVYGPDQRATMFNAAYRDIMGEAAVRIGESLLEVAARRQVMGEFDAAMGQRLFARHTGPDAEQATPIRRHRPNGTVLDTRAARLPDGGHLAVTVDVTALHRAEQALATRAAMQTAMLENIRHGIILYDRDRRVLATNARTAELTGMPARLLTPGRLMDDMLDEQVLRGQMSPEGAAQMKGYDRTLPHRYGRKRPDGRVLEVTSDPLPDGGYVITYADVTDDRRIRAELEGAKLEAEGASRAKSRFLATMTHELRSPLSAVIGFAEAVAGARDPARIADYAGAIRDAGQHLLLLIDDILDVARSQGTALAVAADTVTLGPVLERAQRAAATLAGDAGLTFMAEWPADLPRLAGDARRVHQVLLNLISNAVKFTPDGGRVRLSAALEDGSLAIRVADTGIGIPPEFHHTVFEPFTQLDDAHARHFPGSGLGLYMARSLAEAMGGTLTLDSPTGPGTIALLRFPPERLLPPEPMPEGPTP